MSGHSKWSQIKRQKGVADVRRAGLFTKLSKSIAVAARDGKDPSGNVRLRLAIDLARQANMPNENIDRAIKRGAGEIEGQIIEEITYEAYGPGGSALVIRAHTDNKNRTSSALRSILSKNGGNLGQSGSVLWMFALKGAMRLPRESLEGRDVDALTLALIDAGADDVIDEPEGLTVSAQTGHLTELNKILSDQGFSDTAAALEFIPTTKIQLDQPTENKLNVLCEELETHEDVDAVFTNAG